MCSTVERKGKRKKRKVVRIKDIDRGGDGTKRWIENE